MKLCIELAAKGIGHTAPNPLVGAIIVHNGEIIGQGFHEEFGKSHAEVNAINSVDKKFLLEESTLYVNLEPCAHYGKTPPCADLIVVNKIPKVVIGSTDPFPEVAGKGIEILKKSGVDVVCGVLEKECIELNKRFYTFHTKHRPYIILKWAKTNDGFIAGSDQERGRSLKITNSNTNIWVHERRSENQAILVGKNTILADDPQLNVRLVEGKQPIPFVLGKKEDIPGDYQIHLSNPVFFQTFEEIKKYCLANKIQSIFVEGGKKVLEYFIRKDLWDDIYIITNTEMKIGSGIKAPVVVQEPTAVTQIGSDLIEIVINHFSHD